MRISRFYPCHVTRDTLSCYSDWKMPAGRSTFVCVYASDFRWMHAAFTFISDCAVYWSLQLCPSFRKEMAGDVKGLTLLSFMTNACDAITYVARSFQSFRYVG